MKKYIFSIAAVAAMFASCSQEADLEIVDNGAKAQAITTVSASSESSSRAVVSGTSINWVIGDQLGVLGTNASTEVKNTAYTLSDGQGTTTGTFTNAQSDITTINAIMYPYQSSASWVAANSKLTCEIPSVQTGVKDSFDKNAAIMYAIGSSTSQALSLAVNFLKVNITETNVHSITISSSAALSGKMEITSTGVTSAATGTYNYVKLVAGANIENCFATGDYYIAVKPGDITTPTISYVYYDATNHKATEKSKTASGDLSFANGKNVKPISVDFASGTVIQRDAVQLWAGGPYFATMNVGATSETNFGGYYTWGGTFANGEGITWNDDHNTSNTGSGNLSSEDDTATNLWGNNWRMPKSDELQDLSDNCDVTWTDNFKETGIKGRIFTGKDDYASNSVFLPAAGYCDYGDVFGQGSNGYYWSSTPDGSYYAFHLGFLSGIQDVVDDSRDYGYSVRALLSK